MEHKMNESMMSEIGKVDNKDSLLLALMSFIMNHLKKMKEHGKTVDEGEYDLTKAFEDSFKKDNTKPSKAPTLMPSPM